MPNIVDNDVTLSETKGSGIKLDISKGDMRFQFTIPTAYTDQKVFGFKAADKKSGKDLLVNGQPEFIASPSIPLAPTSTLVIHKEGQEWENIRSSYLGSGINTQATSGGNTVEPSSGSTSTANGSNGSGTGSTTTSTTSNTGVVGPTAISSVKLVFSNRKANEDVSIQEQGGAFTNISIPRNTYAMNLGFDIPGSLSSLELTGQGDASKEPYYLNGERNLKVDVAVPPSAVIVHEKGNLINK